MIIYNVFTLFTSVLEGGVRKVISTLVISSV